MADDIPHLAGALTRGARERPDVQHDATMIAEAMRLAATTRPVINARFLAETAVDAFNAHVDDGCDAATIARTVVGTWDMETEAHRDEMASAGLA